MSVESLRLRIADFLAAHDPKATGQLEFLRAAGVYDVPVATSVARAFAVGTAGAHRARLAGLVDLPRAGE